MVAETVLSTTAGAAISTTGILGLSAGLAIGLAALATAYAQRDAMAAAIGAISEDPKIFSKALIFAVLPETILIFGFVTAFLILGKI